MASSSAAQKQAKHLAKFHAENVARDIPLSKKGIALVRKEMMQCMQDWHAWFVLYGGRR